METITVNDVFAELKKIEQKMATKEDIESLTYTIEIMSNPDTMRQIVDSMSDIQEGKEVHSVKDMLDEMWAGLLKEQTLFLSS